MTTSLQGDNELCINTSSKSETAHSSENKTRRQPLTLNLCYVFDPTALTKTKLVVTNHITFRSVSSNPETLKSVFYGWAEQLYSNSAAQKQTTI